MCILPISAVDDDQASTAGAGVCRKAEQRRQSAKNLRLRESGSEAT